MSKAKSVQTLCSMSSGDQSLEKRLSKPKWIGVTCPGDVSQAVISTTSGWHNGVMNRVIMGAYWRLCKDPTISIDKAFWTFVPSTSHTVRKHSINVTIYCIRQTVGKLYCKYLNIQSIGKELQMSQLLHSVHCKAMRHFPLHFLLPQSIPKEWLKHRKTSLCPPSLVNNDHFSHEGACSNKETHWQENVMFHIHASALLQMLSWHHHIVCD